MNKSIRTRLSLRTRVMNLLLVSLLASSAILLLSTKVAAQSVAAQRERPTRMVSFRRVFVRSKSLLVRGAVVEDKLLKRAEFKELGFVITRDESDADIILELRHDLLTKYVQRGRCEDADSDCRRKTQFTWRHCGGKSRQAFCEGNGANQS